jgi:hypothetical protein
MRKSRHDQADFTHPHFPESGRLRSDQPETGHGRPGKKEARMEPEAKAVGSACRQSGRAIEDCYSIYSWLPKAGIYAGWREMDEYMRENKLETIVPLLPPPEPPGNRKKRKPAAQDTAPDTDTKAESGTKADAEKS